MVLDLPAVPLPDLVLGVTLLGPVTREALLAGLYDGLRLATIVICVGAANSLANPKRLLRSLPPALYEIGTALVVAVTVLPQFTHSIQRVRAAQALRAGETGRVRRLRRFLVPVLEDTFDRSLALAAGMDTRGYGRSGTATARRAPYDGGARARRALRRRPSASTPCSTRPRRACWPGRCSWSALPVAVAGLVVSGRRVQRTRYRPDRWRAARDRRRRRRPRGRRVLGWWVSRHQLPIAYPDVTSAPAGQPGRARRRGARRRRGRCHTAAARLQEARR